MKFKLLLYYCHLFDFAPQLSSSALLSLSDLSSAAKFYLDSGISLALLNLAFFYDGDHSIYVVTVLRLKNRKKSRNLIHSNSIFLSKSRNFILAKCGS